MSFLHDDLEMGRAEWTFGRISVWLMSVRERTICEEFMDLDLHENVGSSADGCPEIATLRRIVYKDLGKQGEFCIRNSWDAIYTN